MSWGERYKKDIDRLTAKGQLLSLAMDVEFRPGLKAKISKEQVAALPSVISDYEKWYSEALALVVQLLPDRAEDFRSYYRPKSVRRDITPANYTMSDYLRGLSGTRGTATVFDGSAAVLPMHQQANIVEALQQRFQSTLYDIKTLVHADLLDDELAAAEELNLKGFQRGAGAIAGVALESHLGVVCNRHNVVPKKKVPAISDLNDALKSAALIEVAVWRFIQHLGDLRNKCDHKKSTEPSELEVRELIDGVRKITKTVF